MVEIQELDQQQSTPSSSVENNNDNSNEKTNKKSSKNEIASINNDDEKKSSKNNGNHSSSSGPKKKKIKDNDKKKLSYDNMTNEEKYNDLMKKMSNERDKWIAEKDDDDDPDDTDHLLTQAIQLAIEQGRGWGPGEKEAYLEKILDDDFIPPLFASTQEEVEKSGLQEAFTSLIYDDENPTSLMISFRKKGNDSFTNGKRNKTKQNLQYYRDAINYWYEAYAWSIKIKPLNDGDYEQADVDEETYTEIQLDEIKSTICSNIALAHMQLSNWGYVRNECKKSIQHNPKNVKSWYRLAKAYENLKDYENAGDAIDSGLQIDTNNIDLCKLRKQLEIKIRKARQQRQQRERKRAERIANVKAVWKHCNTNNIRLGRIPLVASVSDGNINDDDDDDIERQESKWNNHLPYSGMLPHTDNNNNDWYWPCIFVYPSHNQSDFVTNFNENDILAIHMGRVFPEIDNNNNNETTSMPWDYNNEFICSNLAVYYEVHETAINQADQATIKNNDNNIIIQHPDCVELIKDQSTCMKYYESTRALKGDEGIEIANVVRLIEQKHLNKLRKLWKKHHGSLWAKPDPCPIVRVHPAMTLHDILTDTRMVVPNFLVTLIMFPENHPAHAAYLKEHKCIGILQPTEQQT